VLLALADCAGGGGDDSIVWPCIKTISDKTSQDRKTVISALDELERIGFLIDTGKKVGATGQVKVYQLAGLPSGNHHYIYKLEDPGTGEFYLGVRTCVCKIEQDPYMGSGKWPQQNRATKLVKSILNCFETRQEAEAAEVLVIRAECDNPKCQNVVRYRPSNSTVLPIKESRSSVETVPEAVHVSVKESSVIQNTAPTVVAAPPDGGQPAPEEGSPAEPKKERKRNELLDTLAKIDGADPLKVPPMGWSKYAKVLKNVKTVVPEITPEILLRAAKKYRQIHPTWELTATALASHWGECYTDEKPEPQKTLPEPVGWKEFVDKNMPDCPYAGIAVTWGQVDPEHQQWIINAMDQDRMKGAA